MVLYISGNLVFEKFVEFTLSVIQWLYLNGKVLLDLELVLPV